MTSRIFDFEYLLQVRNAVSAEGEDVELLAVVETGNLLDVVVVERQILQLHQVLQPLDLPDVVEAQVCPMNMNVVELYRERTTDSQSSRTGKTVSIS